MDDLESEEEDGDDNDADDDHNAEQDKSGRVERSRSDEAMHFGHDDRSAAQDLHDQRHGQEDECGERRQRTGDRAGRGPLVLRDYSAATAEAAAGT